jgi:hypothetical protein
MVFVCFPPACRLGLKVDSRAHIGRNKKIRRPHEASGNSSASIIAKIRSQLEKLGVT